MADAPSPQSDRQPGDPPSPAVRAWRPHDTGEPDAPPIAPAPWLLQLHFDGEIDLDAELVARASNMPLLSIIHVRDLGATWPVALATLASQDGASTVTFEVERASRALDCTFTFASMLSLRFSLRALNDLDRAHWLTVLRGGHETPVFLWSENRWQTDYLIAVPHRYFTNLYAFSPRQIEASVRLTPEVTRKLLDWLASEWQIPASP